MSVAPFLLALGAALCFGLSLVVARFGLRHAPPLSGSCVSIPVACLLFLLAAPLTVSFEMASAAGLWIFVAIGCAFPLLVSLLTYQSNRRIGANLTGALGNLTPVVAVGIAAIWLGESPAPLQFAGLAIVCIGIFLLFGLPGGTYRVAIGWALAWPLLASVVRGVVQPAVKVGLARWPDPFAAVTIGYVMSSVIVLAIGFAAYGARPWPRSPGACGWFALVGVFNGAAVLALYSALDLGSVTLVAPLVACFPLVTLLANRWLFDDDRPDPWAYSGIFLMVTGVVVLLTV